MERLMPAMRVLTINDLPLGEVGNILSCCFEVRAPDGTRFNLEPAAIFNVANTRVSLVCMLDHVDTYACKIHGVKGALLRTRSA
jgi:hypothetical protein